MEEDILAIEQELESKSGQSREHLSEWATKEANPKLNKAAAQLKAMRTAAQDAGRSTDAIDQVTARLKGIYGRVLTEALNLPASVAANIEL